MGRWNSLSLFKRILIGFGAIVVVILTIPLLVMLSQERKTLHTKAAVPTPATLAFSSGFATITGYVYHDDNSDGERKEEEKPIAQVRILLEELSEDDKDTVLSDTTTDSYGYFSFNFNVKSSNAYMVKVVLPKNYKTVDTNPIIISDLKPNGQKIVEFGLVPFGEALTISPTRKPAPKADPTLTETPTTVASPTPTALPTP